MRIKRRIYEDKMKDIYKELLDTKDIKGYTQEYLAWKKISLHIINRYPDISMMLSCQRYPFISLKLILVLLRIKGYLGISWDKWGYLRISFWGELPDVLTYPIFASFILERYPTLYPVTISCRISSLDILQISTYPNEISWWHILSDILVGYPRYD